MKIFACEIRRMRPIELTDDDVETVRALIEDWGWDYALTADREKVVALARKLGLDSWADANK